MRRAIPALAMALLLFAVLPAAASAERLTYRYGPIAIAPGQNTIEFEPNDLKPPVDGYITSFEPDLTYTDGSIPRVDVIHLHHGVWIANGAPQFAAGEEKTRLAAPSGYGWRYDTEDRWIMNHMIHNLTPTKTEVYITYELEFTAAAAPAASAIRPVRTVWMDVMGLQAYPVFDALRGAGGRDGRFTYPDERPSARAAGRNRWVVDQDGVLVATAGHLHPGGLYTDLELTRDGRTVRLFRSQAKYFEPAGAVSWDVAMTATPPQWRAGVRRGDVLSVSATYDTKRASWYESMGIMPVAFDAGGSGPDPFTTDVDVPGRTTHGHLAENDNHGGGPFGLPDPFRLRSGSQPAGGRVEIAGFLYGRGDLNRVGRTGRPPTVRAGRSLTFVNRDAGRRDVMHTITACKAPCNRRTGIAYPLADGPVRFDSGNLGTGPRGFTAASNRISWKTPRSLRRGTYTYFCRVHPFMRGAFRVRG